MRKELFLFLALGLAGAPLVDSQPRGGIVRGKILNGTTGGPGRAERVTLIRMASGMEPVARLDNVSGGFTLEGFEVAGESPYLLQVTSGGVNYNQPLSFGRGYEAEASLTVYDLTAERKDIEISAARFLFRRASDRLRVDKIFVVENKSEPKKTFFQPEGTFKFYLPPEVVELRAVSASSGGGMPVPQAASQLADKSGHVTKTAFKPGTTEITISYDVDYSNESYRFQEKAYYPLPEALALVAPANVQVQVEGLEELGPEPEGRFLVLRGRNLPAGATLDLTLSGGSDGVAESASSSGGADSSTPRVTRLPDPSRPQKWIIVILMGAALAYGLLNALVPGPGRDRTTADSARRKGLLEALADLESRHAAKKISSSQYRRKRRELRARLERPAREG